MIWEAFQYLTTRPKLPVAKDMDYLKESIAMVARAKRCQPQWNAHYQQCQQAIIKSFNCLEQKRIAIIIGAGTLHDVPLTALSEAFEKVILVDLVFLKSAYRMADKYDNIELVEHDVTESLNEIKNGSSKLVKPERWLEDERVDLVVSLNLVTQLPLIPVRWLMKRFHFTEAQVDSIGKQLISEHLSYLSKFDARVCLIADQEDVEFNQAGEVVDRFDPWWEVEPPKTEYTWEWQVIPLGEGRPGVWQQNRVGVSFL